MLNTHKTGLTLGSFMGLFHLVWSVLVYLGWAQPLLDFIYGLHSISSLMLVEEFDLVQSVGLVIVTAIIGYVLGSVFAMIWNKVQR